MEKTLTALVSAALAVGLAIGLSSCAFHVGFDYNGKTGIDNRTQTQLLNADKHTSRPIQGY